MGVKKLKPTSPGRRFQTVSDFETITKSKPEKSLLAKQKRLASKAAAGGTIFEFHTVQEALWCHTRTVP